MGGQLRCVITTEHQVQFCYSSKRRQGWKSSRGSITQKSLTNEEERKGGSSLKNKKGTAINMKHLLNVRPCMVNRLKTREPSESNSCREAMVL